METESGFRGFQSLTYAIMGQTGGGCASTKGEILMTTAKERGRPAEKRRVPRIQVDFPVQVIWGRRQYRWRAQELSEYGIMLTSPNKELVGEEIQVGFTLNPKDPALSLTGLVVYATKDGLGIRFKIVSSEDQAVLRAYVQGHGIGIIKPSVEGHSR